MFILLHLPPEHTPTHCNPRFLRWRAWLNNEMLVVGGGVVRIHLDHGVDFLHLFSLHTINNWNTELLILHPPASAHPPTLIQGFLRWSMA